jgi:hypothetical protein
MLLAGDPIAVSIESAVVRGRVVVEARAALEVRDRVCPAARVVVRIQLADAMRVPHMHTRAVRPPRRR